MKTAFEIKGEEPGTSDTHVLLEFGQYGMSILKFRKDPFTIDSVFTYQFPEDVVDKISENVKEVITESAPSNKDNVHVFCNVRESFLVPAEFMHEDAFAKQMDLLYGISPGAELLYDEIIVEMGIGKQDKMYCVYRMPYGLQSLVETISTNKLKHATSVMLKSGVSNTLYCTIFHNTIKLFLYGNDQLLIVQQFAYRTPADVVYHLLNVCDKYNLSPSEIDLYIDGMIDSNSSLYQEIYKYFLHIHFNVIADDVFLSAGIKEHPLHFVTHLTDLARCV